MIYTLPESQDAKLSNSVYGIVFGSVFMEIWTNLSTLQHHCNIFFAHCTMSLKHCISWPSSAVLDSNCNKVVSVCSHNFANAIHSLRVNRRFRTLSEWPWSNNSSNTGIEHWTVVYQVIKCIFESREYIIITCNKSS